MSTFHGVETIELFEGPRPMRSLRYSVIGLVGTAPVQNLEDPDDATVNTMVLCANEADDAKYFGADTAGYSIPSALKALRAQGTGLVIVVNVFNPETHLDGDDEPDPAEVLAADIVGTTSGGGVRSGLQCFLEAKSQFGFNPRILQTPGWSNSATVAAALRAMAPKVRGICLIDAPFGSTPAAAITGRTGDGHVFNTASDRAYLLYPYLKAAGPDGDPTNQPYSQFMAGVIAARDKLANGPYWSPSNLEIQGVVGVERLLTAAINDDTTEVQLLNAAGIATYLPGAGIRTFGNRSAAYPTVTTVNNFLSVRRTADVIEDAIEEAQLQFMDAPMTPALLAQIVENVNEFMRTKVGEGWIISGRCWMDPDDNTLSSLADGHGTYRYEFLPPIPNEKTTFKGILNTNLLATLLGA